MQDVQLTDEQKAKAHASALACIEQEGITKEQGLTLRDGKFDNVDGKVKCFANCFLEKAGFIADGQVKPDVVEQKLTPIFGAENVKAAQAKCDSIKGTDNCDTAFQLYKCYHENNGLV